MAPKNRPPVEIKLLDGEVEVSSRSLAFEKACDIKADVFELVTKIADELRKNIATANVIQVLVDMKDEELEAATIKLLPRLLPAITRAAELLAATRADGKNLEKYLAPLIMAETTVVATNEEGVKERFEFSKRAEMAKFFDLYLETYHQILWHAGRVTFQRFFPEIVRLVSRFSTRKIRATG